MKKLIVAALFSAASLAQAGPQAASEGPGGSKSLIQRLGSQAQGLSDRASDVVFNAMGKLDVPYRLGGNTRETGFDCSGLVHAVYEQTLGLVLPRRAAEQAHSTQKIDKDELKPGDLVFFNTMRRSFSHVGIYIGDNKFIHAPRTGSRVRVENMNIKYWQSRFDGARRVSLTGADHAPKLASAFMSSEDSSTYQLALAKVGERDAAYASANPASLLDNAPEAGDSTRISRADTQAPLTETALSKPAKAKSDEVHTAKLSDKPSQHKTAKAEKAEKPSKSDKTAKAEKPSKAEKSAKTKAGRDDAKQAKGKQAKSTNVTAKAESGKTSKAKSAKQDDKSSKLKSASGKSSARRA